MYRRPMIPELEYEGITPYYQEYLDGLAAQGNSYSIGDSSSVQCRNSRGAMTSSISTMSRVSYPLNIISMDRGTSMKGSMKRGYQPPRDAEDSEVTSLKEKLRYLKQHNLLTTIALSKRHEAMIRRDEERHRRFLLEFKSAEQVEKERLDELDKVHTLERKALETDETSARVFFEEEQVLEYGYDLFNLNLRQSTLSVAHRFSDKDIPSTNTAVRRIQETKVKELVAVQKLVVGCELDAMNSRREIEQMENKEMLLIMSICESDKVTIQGGDKLRKRLHHTKELVAMEALQEKMGSEETERRKRQEVDMLEAQFQDKMRNIGVKYRDLSSSVSEA
eukprot:Tbor_TRINITY_DN2759_c0_g1::TRINITY_DN2759_c0_g1_i1::g.15184::m.15184